MYSILGNMKIFNFRPHLVARSGVPIMFCPERNMRGSIVTSWKDIDQFSGFSPGQIPQQPI